jgi:hypothetical protein
VAQKEFIELYGNGSGLVESSPITVASDSELILIYKTNKCYSAWLEIKTPSQAIPYKIQILTHKPVPTMAFPSGTIIKLVASMGEGRSIEATLILKTV